MQLLQTFGYRLFPRLRAYSHTVWQPNCQADTVRIKPDFNPELLARNCYNWAEFPPDQQLFDVQFEEVVTPGCPDGFLAVLQPDFQHGCC